MNKYPQARKPHVLGPCLIAMYNTRIRDGIPENPCGKSHRLRQLISMMLDAQCIYDHIVYDFQVYDGL